MEDHSGSEAVSVDEEAQRVKEIRSSRRTLIGLIFVTGLSLTGIIIGFVQRLMQS